MNLSASERIIKLTQYCVAPIKALAPQIGLNPQRLYDIKSGKTQKVSEDVADAIITKYPEISKKWLLTGSGAMITKNNDENHDSHEDCVRLPLIPVTAFAGYGTPAFQDEQISEWYAIPEMKGADFLLRVTGDSMTPKLQNGDIVACKMIEDLQFWQWGKIYALYTEQGVIIKKVQPAPDENNIMCVSLNKDYPFFAVPKSSIKSIALVIGAVVTL